MIRHRAACSAGIPRKTWFAHLVISFTVSWSSFSPRCFLWPSLLSNKQPIPNYLHRFATDFVALLPSHSWPCMVLLMQSPRCCWPCKIVIPERSQIISSSHLWTLVTSPLTTCGIQPSLTVPAVTSVCFLHCYQWHLEISCVVMVSRPVVFHILFS